MQQTETTKGYNNLLGTGYLAEISSFQNTRYCPRNYLVFQIQDMENLVFQSFWLKYFVFQFQILGFHLNIRYFENMWHNQHDCFIGHQLQLLAFESDTPRFVHVFQRAINNFEILLLASINTYKPETNLTVLFAIKVFRSALKIEFTRSFIGKSYKQHQINIFQTFQTEIRKKKMKIYYEQFCIDICLWFWIWYILFCINTYTFILICVQIQFKGPSWQIGILLRNRSSNMRFKLQIN